MVFNLALKCRVVMRWFSDMALMRCCSCGIVLCGVAVDVLLI